VPANDRVLIEIVTAANMAGVKEAQAGFLGFTPAVLGAGLAIAGLVMGAKSMIEISTAQATAEGDLKAAIDARNASALKTPTPDPAVVKEVAKATDAHAKAVESLAKMELSLGAPGHKETALQAYNLAAAHQKVTDTANALIAAHGKLGESTQADQVNTAALKAEIDGFIKSNAGHINSLADVTTGYANLVREGVPAKDLTRDMNIAVNIAAAEGISLSDATDKLQSMESGRNVGLKKMVGITLETIPATATLAEKHAILERNTLKVKDAFAGAADNLPPLTQNSNKLSVIWQTLADKDGPSLTKGITDMENSIIAGLPTWLDWLDKIGRVSDALQNWQQQSSTSTHNAITGGVGGFFDRLGSGASAVASQFGRRAAAGGTFGPGPLTVGEQGTEQLYLPGGGTVVPHGGGVGGQTIEIHIHGGLYADGPSLDRLCNAIAQRMNYATGR
jgi:hypothetical protein